MLRLDWNLLFTVINILILYLLMKKFLLKPINAVIAKRQEKIENDIKAAAQSKDEAAALKQQYEAGLSDAKAESGKLIAEAGVKARAEYDRIMDNARVQADTVMEEARKKTEEEKNRTMKAMTDEITGLAMEAAEKIVSGKCNDSLNQSMYDEFLNQTDK